MYDDLLQTFAALPMEHSARQSFCDDTQRREHCNVEARHLAFGFLIRNSFRPIHVCAAFSNDLRLSGKVAIVDPGTNRHLGSTYLDNKFGELFGNHQHVEMGFVFLTS